MLKVIRAFFSALMLTLRGQTVERPYGALLDWMEAAAAHADAVEAAADAAGMPAAARTAFKLRVEGRDTTMQTIVGAVRYHAREEYPFMLKNPTQNVLTAIYATNMNDSFQVTRLALALPEGPTRAAVESLSNHLQNIPPSTSLQTGLSS